jgi:hypothetical protein
MLNCNPDEFQGHHAYDLYLRIISAQGKYTEHPDEFNIKSSTLGIPNAASVSFSPFAIVSA